MSKKGWREVTLDEVCSVIKRGISPKYTEENGVIVINQRCIRDQKVRFENARKNDLLKKKVPEDRYLESYDVLVNSTGVGTLGRVAQIQIVKNKITVDSHVTIVRLSDKNIDQKYFGWLVRDKQSVIENLGEGSTGQTELSRYRLGGIKIELPNNLQGQKAIAKILGDLDAKIELNGKMNENLEAMAQSLFQSWFVDFDPVLDNFLAKNDNNVEALPETLRKKGALRLEVSKKNTPEINTLFPSNFVFNEVLEKWIPEGWDVKTIDDCATIVGGGTPSTKVEEYFCKDGIPWLSPKDLSGYKWKYIDKGAKDITDLGLKKSSAKLMPAGTVLFSSRAPIGYIAIAENEVSTNQGFKSLIPNKGLPTEYLFQFLKQNALKIESVATGSTFKEVSGSALKSIPVIVPSKNILEELIKRTKELNSHLLVNQKQTQNLTKLRDTLLPQLISGKLEVPEAMLVIEKRRCS